MAAPASRTNGAPLFVPMAAERTHIIVTAALAAGVTSDKLRQGQDG